MEEQQQQEFSHEEIYSQILQLETDSATTEQLSHYLGRSQMQCQ